MITKKERARNEPFPQEGFVTDEQIAYFVGIHVATVWAWVKNGYAQAVYEYFEQIEKLLSAGDTIYSLFEFFRDSDIFTRDADYRFFDRAFVREKRRRAEAQVKKSQSPRSNALATTIGNDDGNNGNSIKPRKDRKEF